MELVERLARAILYEGYVLYPYRADALKNRQRFNFGIVAPLGSADAKPWETACLIAGATDTRLNISVRFLQLQDCAQWQSARERVIDVSFQLPDLLAGEHLHAFQLAAETEFQALSGAIKVAAINVGAGVFRVQMGIENHTASILSEQRTAQLAQSFLSTHAVLRAVNGAFVSLLEPPAWLQSEAATCVNRGAWPVLVGEQGTRDTMLAAPIILYDYPQVAPESADDFCDLTEIDELLALRVLTLTEEEKQQMRQLDARSAAMLKSIESLSDAQLRRLHGAWRDE